MSPIPVRLIFAARLTVFVLLVVTMDKIIAGQWWRALLAFCSAGVVAIAVALTAAE